MKSRIMSTLAQVTRPGVVLAGLLCMTSHAALGKDLSINLLENASFDSASGSDSSWKLGSEVFQIDTQVKRSGKASLRWSNDNPDTYRLTTQMVPLEVGRVYEISAWIKTENVEGVRESGATIALGFSDKDGKYIKGGPHPGGQKGTGDWWQLIAYTPPIPENVAQGAFTCYVRKRGEKNFTGTAWWDDLVLRPVSLEVRMFQPVYKARVTNESRNLEIEFVAWAKDFGLKSDDVKVNLVIRPEGQESASTFERSFDVLPGVSGQTQNIQLDLSELQEGMYDVEVSLRHVKTGQKLWTEQRSIQRVSQSIKELRVYLDEHHRLIVDGKPFFPIGMYTRKDPIAVIKGSPFNCIMSYDPLSKAQMDAANQAGLKVIYSLKDYYNRIWYAPTVIKSVHDEVPALLKVVRTFRDHPALLAWYVNDELGADVLLQHREHYKAINAEDPHHPAWSLHFVPHEMRDLVDTADVFGIDSYPVPEEPLSKVGHDVRGTVNAVRHKRAVWAVPQIFSWTSFGRTGRPPTLNEMRNMSWQSICSGANGLIYYAFHDVQKDIENFETRWKDIQAMASEVARYSDILLSVEELPGVKVTDQPWLQWTARRVGDTLYVFALSDASGQGEVTFELTGNVRSIEREVLGKTEFHTHPSSSNGKWSDRIESAAVHVYRIRL
jgi:hypothetical protein